MSSNPFPYFKTPKNLKEAQSNVNYWHFEKMGGCPQDVIEANWNVFMIEMEKDAKKRLSYFVIDNKT